MISANVLAGNIQKNTEETNIVLIDLDMAEFFPDHDSINDALRSLIKIIKNRQERFAGRAEGQ